MELTWQVLPSPSLQKVSERMPEHFSEEECCLQLEGVGLVFEFKVLVVLIRGHEDASRLLHRKIIADADFQAFEESHSATYIPCGRHVFLTEISTLHGVLPAHVLQGKSELRNNEKAFAEWLKRENRTLTEYQRRWIAENHFGWRFTWNKQKNEWESKKV